jgi:thiamine biosynthesis lipoprotein
MSMSKENLRILFGIFLSAILIVAVYFLLRPQQVEVDSGFRRVMGTFARVLVVAPDKRTAQRCIDTAFEQFRQTEALMSWRKDDSEIARINRDAYAKPVRVSEPTFEVLQKSIEFSRLSEGALISRSALLWSFGNVPRMLIVSQPMPNSSRRFLG